MYATQARNRRAVGMHGHGHHEMNVYRVCCACNASTFCETMAGQPKRHHSLQQAW